MQNNFEYKFIMDNNNSIYYGNNETHDEISNRIINNNEYLKEKYDGNDNKIFFLLEEGYMFFNIEVKNYKTSLILLYSSTNISEENNRVLFDILNEDTRKEKIKELFRGEIKRQSIYVTEDIELTIKDAKNRLQDKNLKEEIKINGIKNTCKKLERGLYNDRRKVN